MNNILVIDDEPIILEALYNTLLRMEEHQLTVWKAMSAIEGMEIMRANRIDILLTDVRMPGMSGLELVGIVRKQWERCKIIILSGYSDYEYLQSALQQSVCDYLLKPVDEEVVVAAVTRAIGEIEAQMQVDDWMMKAEHQLHKAQSLLYKDFSEKLFAGELAGKEELAEAMELLQIPLGSSKDAILVVGRTDRWPHGYVLKEKLLLQYAIHNIMKEFLDSACRMAVFFEDGYIVWIFQDKAGEQGEGKTLSELHWYISEILDKIQEAIRQYLRLSVSLVLSKPHVSWQAIAQTFKEMCDWLQRGIGLEKEIIFVEQLDSKPGADGQEPSPVDIKRSMNQLANLLESGNLPDFAQELARFFRAMQERVYLEYTFQLEIYCHLSAMFLSYINRRQMLALIEQDVDMAGLANYGQFAHWPELEAYFLRLANQLLSAMQGENTSQKKEIVDEIDAYIVKSFTSDYISLTHLAKTFQLSASYLSRLYHAEKGIPITERIKELRMVRAKELLLVEGKKIQEVALELGFFNVPYFSKFFKKNTGVTPQEYKQSFVATGTAIRGGDNK